MTASDSGATRSALRLGVVLVAAACLAVACYQEAPKPEERSLAVFLTGIQGVPEIRVQLADDLGKASLAVSGPYAMEAVQLSGRNDQGGGQRAVTVDITPTARGIRLGAQEFERARILPKEGTAIELRYSEAGKERSWAFSHPVEFQRRMGLEGGQAAPRLRVIVRLSLEEYLVGVVGSEMSPRWPMEALRAQAAASRSFALYNIKTRKEKEYDVQASVMSQVWRPSRQADPRVVMAVNSTRGAVLLDRNRLFPAYFHSLCGGSTADARRVFLQTDIPALWGVKCPYCLESGEVIPTWRLTLSKADLSARLRRAGLIRGEIRSIKPLDEDGQPLAALGRVCALDISLVNGPVVRNVPANEFRLAVGPDRRELESTFFAIAQTESQITFEGRGFGHGVGMCQHGANYMAKKGRDWRSILARYYTGSTIARLW